MRKHIVAGNWKMNKTEAETTQLIDKLKKQNLKRGVDIFIAPTFVNLYSAVKAVSGSGIRVVAQNMHQSVSGAFTGEISSAMLLDIGVHHVILGHSERRNYFGETDKILKEKVQAALQSGLNIIFCIGEELKDRKSNTHFDVVKQQLSTALFDLDTIQWQQIVLAYEPVWAIGTGETASPREAQEMHSFIRSLISKNYDKNCADGVSILYGGSVKPANAREIFSQVDVDGGLIGGASLHAEDFAAIINGF